MRPQSLPILGAFFLSAFIGRAIVLAAETNDADIAAPSSSEQIKACMSGALASELQKNLDSLDARRVALANQEGYIAAAKTHADERIAELEKLNASLHKKLDAVDSARATELKRVAAIYEQMKPALGSAIFAKMDPKFAAGLLMSMNEETASAILAGLDSDRAYSITVLMTNRAMQMGDAS